MIGSLGKSSGKKSKFNNLLRSYSVIVLLITFLYVLVNNIIRFYRGYHNLDIAFNFLKLGTTYDINTAYKIVDLNQIYLIGLNQMIYALGWLSFCCIFGVLIGYLIKK